MRVRVRVGVTLPHDLYHGRVLGHGTDAAGALHPHLARVRVGARDGVGVGIGVWVRVWVWVRARARARGCWGEGWRAP